MKSANKTPKTTNFFKSKPSLTKIKKFCQELELQTITLQNELSGLVDVNQALRMEIQVYHGNVLPSIQMSYPSSNSSSI